MSPSLEPFRIPALQNLRIGTPNSRLATGHDGPTMVKGVGWSLPAGAYTARQIVEGCAPLLETVLHHLGPDQQGHPSARQMLLDNLASNLALDTRESSLTIPLKDASRREFANQAAKIGKDLVKYARETTNVTFDRKYAIRSPCEGHLLKPAVAQLMFGPRSLGHLMQIYNEYLHQIVLLRDALLPFENYDQVIIPIRANSGKGSLGMRFTEPQRMSFIAELMTKLTTQASVYKVAQSLLAPEISPENGYGLQYEYGLILPAAVVGSSSLRLLRYFPTTIDESQKVIKFEYEFSDYYTAPLLEIAPAESTLDEGQTLKPIWNFQAHGINDCSFALESVDPSTHTGQLRLRLEHRNGVCSSVDVGQISRGRRYSSRVAPVKGKAAVDKFSSTALVHTADEVLASSSQNGLVTAQAGGIHLILAANSIEMLALLGRIYPENVVLLEPGASLQDAEEAGKALPGKPRFVVQVVHV